MVLTVSTNISAIAALRQTRSNTSDLSRSVAQLSSGSRINSARDDASGLAISNTLRRDLATIRAAQNNIAQASSMLQIADGGFESMQSKINRMSELAAMSQSGNLTQTEREGLDVEFQLLKDGITQDAQNTTFNGINLMGQQPEFAVDNIGADIQTVDGFIGFSFEVGHPRIQDGDVFDITFNATNQIMELENRTSTFRQTVDLSGITPIPNGQIKEINFEQLGVRLKLNSDFDFTTDLNPSTDNVNFTARLPSAVVSTFVPADLPNSVMSLNTRTSPLNITPAGVQSIGDLDPAAGNNNAFQNNGSRRPDLAPSTVFGQDALDFSGNGNSFMQIANNPAINLSTHNQRSIGLSFRTGPDVTNLQVLYEEGAQVNGIAAYIENGNFFFSIHRGNGAQTAFVSVPISANTDYTASFDFNAGSNTVRGFLNGAEFGNVAGIGGSLPAHSGGNGLGGVNGRIRLHDGRDINAITSFEGQIGGFALQNSSLTDAQHAELDDYFRGPPPTSAGLSDERLQFKIDNTEGALITYQKAQADVLLNNLSGLNVLSASGAQLAQDALREANDFISTERANIGALTSRLEFAATQTDVFRENTTNANSVILDTDIASASTKAINSLTQNQVGITILSFANQSTEQLLGLLEPPTTI